MKIVEGFELTKSLLSRQGPAVIVDGDKQEQKVRQVIADVRNRGDSALKEYTLKFDGIEIESLEVSKQQIRNARHQVDAELISALELAAERIRSFHNEQKDNIWNKFTKSGLGQLIRPLKRIGVYAPGGTASYPSTVLMTAIPARVAGVKEIILVTPPGPTGTVPLPTLVAADITGVNRMFCVGGAQAIAALAFSTESIPQVDKICGPGNIFVVLAKKLVYGVVDIDGLQGPSEVLIIADETAKAEYCAADILAQAEHDPLASAILITTSPRLANEVTREVEQQLKGLARQEIITQSLNKGLIALVPNLDEAIELANIRSPEHLCLMVDRAAKYVKRVSNAGCILVGEKSTVVLGDYVAGPSHVLPTDGTARFSSPLNITDFIKFTSVINIDNASLKQLGPSASVIARSEGLEAHARAVDKRLETR